MLSIVFGGHVDSQTSRNNQMIALGLVIILSIPILVESHNQGLTWGFNSGERFYFKETSRSNISSTVVTLSREYYVVAKDNYTIPDPLLYFILAREQTFFYNGTQLKGGDFAFAVPIGNWDLLEDVYLSSYSSSFDTIAIIDEETSWGFRTTENNTYREISYLFIFSKTDGVLVSLLIESIHDTGHKSSIFVKRVAPPLIINNLVLIAGAFIISIGLVGAYFFKRLRSSANQEPIENRHSY